MAERHGYAGRGTKRHWLYHRWGAMLERCGNPNQPHYERYGGRGITVCERWQDFTNFLADMGEPEDRSLTLERIDNAKGYQPDNVRWATRSEQRANSRTGTIGETHGMCRLTEDDIRQIRASDLTGAQLAARFDVGQSQISRIRLRKSWKHLA